MILDLRNADALRRALPSQKALKECFACTTGFTLPGLMDVFASAVDSRVSSCLLEELQLFARTRDCVPLQSALDAWNCSESTIFVPDMHGIRTLEFYRLRRRADQTSSAYALFQQRFVRSLKGQQFPNRFAEALAGAMVEMTDNVIQHSLSSPGDYSGLAAYHVEPGYMSFGVIDVGQGIVSSLTKSPQWRELRSADLALRAAVCKGASSRPDQPEGEGFRTLFRSLADHDCHQRFRSDNAVLTIKDAGIHREGVVASSPFLNGLQVSVYCTLNEKNQERQIKTLHHSPK